MLTTNNTQDVVIAHITELLAESDGGSTAPAVTALSQIHEIGLSSIMLARLVIGLEGEFGVDPFSEDEVISDMRTVGDLVAAYERATVKQAV